MTDIELKLTEAFRLVFDGLTDEEIQNATPSTIRGWDSAAAITLLAVLEEQFEVELDFEVMAELDSFSKIAAYLAELKK